ncbi:hypothetical protein Acsp01_29540 [Actinoplanes sp. NBRC 101535]|nr:hypothetical protein Acsp01_29540 [Actinoplanes sp. NBRC 101535]
MVRTVMLKGPDRTDREVVSVPRPDDPTAGALLREITGLAAEVAPVSAVDEALDRMRELWWSRLTPAGRLTAHVAATARSTRPTPVAEVLTACRLAGECGSPVRVPEFTSLTTGTVRPGHRGTWSAEVGTRPYGLGHLGDFGSIQAARAAVWDTIEMNRDRLRDAMRQACRELTVLAARGWEEPQVAVWATVDRRAGDDASLVTLHEVAVRARAGIAAADRWRSSEDFPSPVPETSLWHWPSVERWLRDHDRVPPDGLAPARPELPRDRTF